MNVGLYTLLGFLGGCLFVIVLGFIFAFAINHNDNDGE